MRTLQIQIGAVGRFFGGGEHASRNVAGLVAIVILILGFAFLFFALCKDDIALASGVDVLLKFVLPIEMGILGYLFGSARRGK